jgi:predicted RNA-binding Zn ribbon-like protein
MALELANLAQTNGGKPELRAVFASDPASVASIDDSEAEQLLELARQSAEVAGLLASDEDRNIDHAAEVVNHLLEQFPAQLHLTKQEQGWTLHRHRRDAPLVPAWSAVVAGAFARVIGDGRESRVGSCPASDCGRYFYDLSKNNSRRYCSLACQNRTKAAAYRSRKTV